MPCFAMLAVMAMTALLTGHGHLFCWNQMGIHAICQPVKKESDDDQNAHPTQASFR